MKTRGKTVQETEEKLADFRNNAQAVAQGAQDAQDAPPAPDPDDEPQMQLTEESADLIDGRVTRATQVLNACYAAAYQVVRSHVDATGSAIDVTGNPQVPEPMVHQFSVPLARTMFTKLWDEDFEDGIEFEEVAKQTEE